MQKKAKRHKVIANATASWSELPPEMLSTIAQCFDSRLDILRFRAVCRSWRSSFPFPRGDKGVLSPFLPVKTPPPPFNPRDRAFYMKSDYSFVLTAARVFVLEPVAESNSNSNANSNPDFFPQGWLLIVDELNAGRLSIRNPLSKSPVERLPLDFPLVFNLLDFRLTEIGREYNLTYVRHRQRCNAFKVPQNWSSPFEKVVLLSDNPVSASADDCSAVVLFDCGKLAQLSLRDMAWKMVHDGKGFKFDDVVNYKGKLCGINRRGRAYLIDWSSMYMDVIAAPISGGGGRRKRLVESSGDLYLIVRLCVLQKSSPRFKVYKLNAVKKKWFEVASLGDQVFFVGVDFTFSAPATQFTGCQGNCIFFIKKSFPTYMDIDDDQFLFRELGSDLDVGVFSLADGGSFRSVASCPAYSQMLWPPPTWLKQDPCLATCSLSNSIEAVEIALSRIVANCKERVHQRSEEHRWAKEAAKGSEEANKKVEESAEISRRAEKDMEDLMSQMAASLDEVTRRFKRNQRPRNLEEAKIKELCTQLDEAYQRVDRAMERAQKDLMDVGNGSM